jgi:hypothetical protein
MAENIYATDNRDFRRLLSLGFTETEAIRLVYMRNHVGEQTEYREIMAEKHRLNFVRWLIEHNRISR